MDNFFENTLIIIPAYNESETIQKVISGLKNKANILVVDDGSKDLTASLAKEIGAVVISHPANYGYEAALNTGLKYAYSNEFMYAVTFDADGQHNSNIIDDFMGAFASGADLVVGVRENLPRISELLFALIGKLIWGIRDPLSGAKGYRLTEYPNIGNFKKYNSIGSYYAINGSRRGLMISQVHIKINPRRDHSRIGGSIRVNFIILRALINTFIYK